MFENSNVHATHVILALILTMICFCRLDDPVLRKIPIVDTSFRIRRHAFTTKVGTLTAAMEEIKKKSRECEIFDNNNDNGSSKLISPRNFVQYTRDGR